MNVVSPWYTPAFATCSEFAHYETRISLAAWDEE